jgi:hypothetical protein
MQFADPQQLSAAYLILRHIYDGDVIEWPIADDHPLRQVFAALEAQGYIARWDRMWPRRDRYRLTDKGIAQIEAVYKPAGAEQTFDEIRRQNLAPADRRRYLQSRGYDPYLWPILHDPSSQWDSYYDDDCRYYNYFWEDNRHDYRHRHHVHYEKPDLPDPVIAHNVDLDREAADVSAIAAPHSDYDVS